MLRHSYERLDPEVEPREQAGDQVAHLGVESASEVDTLAETLLGGVTFDVATSR